MWALTATKYAGHQGPCSWKWLSQGVCLWESVLQLPEEGQMDRPGSGLAPGL